MSGAVQPSSATSALDASLDKARAKEGVSVPSFLASVLVYCASFVAQLCLFLLLRPRKHKDGHPRPSWQSRCEWLRGEAPKVWKDYFSGGFRYDAVKEIGPDEFFHMRYLTVLLKIFIPLSAVLSPILIPLNLVHGRDEAGNIHGLDRLSWANIPSSQTDRFWAHAILGVLTNIYVCFIVWNELTWYSSYSRDKMLDKNIPRADTVLLVSIPTAYRTKSGVELLLRAFECTIRSVWLNKDCSTLVQKMKEHRQVSQRLETALTAYLRRATEAWNSEADDVERNTDERKRRVAVACRREIWPSFPFRGQKVDELHYWRAKYGRAAAEVDRERRRLQEKPVSGSAFVRFSRPTEAHILRQIVVHQHPGSVIPVCLFHSPEEVVWENVSIDWMHSVYRSMIVKGGIMALVSLFAVPVAFAGTLSQITSLTSIVPGLVWLNALPDWLLGVIQGVIPPAILACLLWSLSTILRKLAVVHGAPSREAVEEVVQEYYFRFLFIQLFFIIVVTSGFVAVKSKMEQGLVATLDAIIRAVPQASNYYLTYLFLQAFSISGSTLLQTEDIVHRFFSGPLLERTLSQQKRRAEGLQEAEWGTHFPTYAALASVGFIYSVISPLILYAEVFCFAFILATRRYIADHGNKRRPCAGASFYPNAVKHLISGLYGMQTVLFLLLLLVTNSEGELACVWQAVVVAAGATCTFFFDRVVQRTFDALFAFLPAANFPRNELGGRMPLAAAADVKEERNDGWKPKEYLPEDITQNSPCVSIPEDPVGFSKLEIADAEAQNLQIDIVDNEGTLDNSGKVSLRQPLM